MTDDADRILERLRSAARSTPRTPAEVEVDEATAELKDAAQRLTAAVRWWQREVLERRG